MGGRGELVMGAVLLGLMALAGCERQFERAARANRDEPIGREGAQVAQESGESRAIEPDEQGRVELTEGQWRKRLTREQYRVLREGGTERPFSSKYWDSEAVGTYSCAACGQELFRSEGKFTSQCGWPSYFEPAGEGRIEYLPDHSHGMTRTEIRCSRCGSHLGHVFGDGPGPTGRRYCVNGVAVDFRPD